MLLFGRPERLQEKPTGIHRIIPRTWPVTGAVGQARHLLNADGRVDVRDPGTAGSRTCVFDGTIGRPKCNVWEPFGYVLHAAEDFYSHSNWADQANPHRRIELVNPPGLAHRDLPAFWDLRDPSATLPDPRLSTGCYPADECQGRILHDELSKDKELINLTTGVVTDPGTPRAKVLTNAQRAVNGAIGEAKRQWAILRWELVKHYGAEKGGKMICALTADTADASCNDASQAVDVYARIPPSYTTIASVRYPDTCLDLYKNEVTDGALIRNHECNGTAAQQFQFAGQTVQFTSIGSSPALRLRGRCLESSIYPGVKFQPCDGSESQQVTVTAAGELQLDGRCITAEPENNSIADNNRCTGDTDQLWELR
jgi:hypothetical protein